MLVKIELNLTILHLLHPHLPTAADHVCRLSKITTKSLFTPLIRVVHNPASGKNGNPATFAVILAIFENSGKIAGLANPAILWAVNPVNTFPKLD